MPLPNSIYGVGLQNCRTLEKGIDDCYGYLSPAILSKTRNAKKKYKLGILNAKKK